MWPAWCQICRWYPSKRRKWRGTKESLEEGERGKWKSWLKTQPSKKIIASGPTTSWQIDREKEGAVTDFIFLGSKITVDSDCSHEIKTYLLTERQDKPRQRAKKQRHHFADKGPFSQSYGFSSTHIWMWAMDHKEGWAPKSWCFWTVVAEKTLENPLDCKRSNQSIPKETTFSIHWKDWCWSSNNLATWRKEPTHWKKTLMLGKIEGRRRRERQRMRCLDSITDSMDINWNKLWERVEDGGAWLKSMGV